MNRNKIRAGVLVLAAFVAGLGLANCFGSRNECQCAHGQGN